MRDSAKANSQALIESETVEKKQRVIIQNIKKMLSLQQQIMSDVGGQ